MTILITVMVTLVCTLIFVVFSHSLSPGRFILVFLLLSLANFTIVKFFLEKYVFRKIKLIYKIIYDSKKDIGSGELFDFNKKSLSDVNEKVMEWATSAKKEIADLKTLEQYRKNYVGNISHEL